MTQPYKNFVNNLSRVLELIRSPQYKGPLTGAFLFGGILFTIFTYLIVGAGEFSKTSVSLIAGGNTLGASTIYDKNTIIVEISGAVKRPGVYRFEKETRVGDIIDNAGGVLDTVDKEFVAVSLNIARIAKDGEKIYIPFIGEKERSSSIEGFVNINTATKSELESLPGVGPAYAQKIIEHRTQNGPFMTKEDIMNVSGIGEGTFGKFSDLISVD